MFFQNLLKQSHNPEHFIALINTWMDTPSNQGDCVANTVDAFLGQLMDEQREHRSHIDDDLFFDLLAAWMKQADVEHRCAMLFNSEHMVGLSCIERCDDVQLLHNIPTHRLFAPNPNSSCVSFQFVSHLLVCAESSPQTLDYIFSTPAFVSILKGGDTCVLDGRALYVDDSDLHSFLWRAFVPSVEGPVATHISERIANIVLDTLHPIVVDVVLDVLSAGNTRSTLFPEILNDQRFQSWSEKDQHLSQYVRKPKTIFPPDLNAHFPQIFEVAACNCAHMIMLASGGNSASINQLQHDLAAVLQPHPNAVDVVRATIEKLNMATYSPLSNFPDSDVDVLIDALSEEHIEQWRNRPWERDEEFSIHKYPQFERALLLSHVCVPPTIKKRSI